MSKFIIYTSLYGGCHLLCAVETVGECGDDFSAAVEVRVDHGRAEPYSFTHTVRRMGDRFELITLEQLAERRQVAGQHGQEYDSNLGKTVFIDVWSTEARQARRLCVAVEAKFRALLVLGAFSLPVTF